MIERCNGSGFLFEPLAVLLFNLLDRHDAARAGVPRLPRFSHPARTDQGEDCVRAEFGAGCKVPYFNKEVQLRTTVNGLARLSDVGIAIRNRLPSGSIEWG
jgi:hypothetical protein